MKAAVLVFPGSNCDRDVAVALRRISGADVTMHWHRDTDIPDVDLLVLPGGFSYGDYLRSGAIAANSPVMREVRAKAQKGVPILGICNGFHMLTELGLLPGALLRNRDLRYICRTVALTVERDGTPFTAAYKKGQTLQIPIAHNDGQYYAAPEILAELQDQNQIAFRYEITDTVPNSGNPNGSTANIAGIINRDGTILGMMPHPERMCESAHGGTDGKGLFDGLANAFA